MKQFQARRSTFLLVLLTAGIFSLNCCSNEPVQEKEQEKEVLFTQFAGSAACAGCHKDTYEKHLQTEHHLTSRFASAETILGSFENGKNAFAFDAANTLVMEKRDSGFFQAHYSNGAEVRKGRFDIVVGSGRKGQSYLSWVRQNSLVQMPITYFSPAGQWSNSPGYPPTKVVFNRPITSRCMECHSTYLSAITGQQNRLEQFDKNRMILGVECERCHGPAAQHVAFQTQNPSSREAKFVINPAKLPRDRQLDLCALCHGGQLTKTKPSFTFTAGDTLTSYFLLQNTVMNAGNIDVHGNQLGLLSLSKCFAQSSMTCTSCHSIHEKEEGRVALFSQRCQSCHSKGHEKICGLTKTIGPAITENCIDCHMPKQPSHAVAVFLQGATSPTPALMRTHYIKIYPEEVKKVTTWLKKKPE